MYIADEKIKKIRESIYEAERFIYRAKKWEEVLKNVPIFSVSGSKEGGSCKRASLDLTRSLAELRK